ncbi:MAG: class I SAM-dependent methyltransferase [Steroidobacterales bacterium]
MLVALWQGVWYRVARIFRPGQPPPAPPLGLMPGVPLRIDLGCGSRKQPGFLGCDRRAFPGVDIVMEMTGRWPWHDGSVDEAHMSHVLEHFTGPERVHIFNELYRVLKPAAGAMIITPHWASNRAYGDFTHAWPPVSEMLYSYVSKEWRKVHAPDNDIEWNPAGYDCDFESEIVYTLHADIAALDEDAQNMAIKFYKEACMDMVVRLKAIK